MKYLTKKNTHWFIIIKTWQISVVRKKQDSNFRKWNINQRMKILRRHLKSKLLQQLNIFIIIR